MSGKPSGGAWSKSQCTVIYSLIAVAPSLLLVHYPVWAIIGWFVSVVLYVCAVLAYGDGHVIEAGAFCLVLLTLFSLIAAGHLHKHTKEQVTDKAVIIPRRDNQSLERTVRTRPLNSALTS